MTPEEHQAEHQRLHKELDTLIACYIASTSRSTPIGRTSIEDKIEDLMRWNYGLCLAPTEAEPCHRETTGRVDWEAERQMIMLALAHLALERPGLVDVLRGIAERYGAEKLFDEYKRLGAQ